MAFPSADVTTRERLEKELRPAVIYINTGCYWQYIGVLSQESVSDFLQLDDSQVLALGHGQALTIRRQRVDYHIELPPYPRSV
jgi:hypothetical protein